MPADPPLRSQMFKIRLKKEEKELKERPRGRLHSRESPSLPLYISHAPCSITTVFQALNYSFPFVFFKYCYPGYQPGGWTTQSIRLTAPQRSRENTYGILFVITGKKLLSWHNGQIRPRDSFKAVNW